MIRVIGTGAISVYGAGVPRLWEGLAAGQSALRTQVQPDGRVAWAGWVEPALVATSEIMARTIELCLFAAREAWAHAPPVDRKRVGIVVGTSVGETEGSVDRVAEAVAEATDITGPRLTVTTACSSSTHAVGLGWELLDRGEVDLVLAGGVDAVFPEVLAGFGALGVLHPDRCTPFGGEAGTTLGEGAGFLLLGAQGEGPSVLGYGLSADAYHVTTPDPRGGGLLRLYEDALAHARVAPSAVGYVNAHGTGTAANDPVESRAIARVFGPEVPFSSFKGHLGHTQAASGVLEGIGVLQGVRRGLLIPTIEVETPPRPGCVGRSMRGEAPVSASTEVQVCVSAAFGGANGALVLGRDQPPRPDLPRRPVWVNAIASLSPARSGSAPRDLDAARDAPLRKVAPMANPRELDRGARILTRAVGACLERAEPRLRTGDRTYVGCVQGGGRASPESHASFFQSIEARGLSGASAPAFARTVLHASASGASQALGLGGPLTCVHAGQASGLVAAAYAARLLAARPMWRGMLACAAEPGSGADDGRAAAVLLSPTGGSTRWLGEAIGAADRGRELASQLLHESSLAPSDVRWFVGAPTGLESPHAERVGESGADATDNINLLIAAVELLGRGPGAALIHARDGAACAVVLLARETT